MRNQPTPSALPDIVTRVRAITALGAMEVATTPLRHGDGRGGDVFVERTTLRRVDEIVAGAAEQIGRATGQPFIAMETLRASEVRSRLTFADAALAQLDMLNAVVRPRLEEIRSMTAALVDDLETAEAARDAAEAAARRDAAIEAKAEAIVAEREAERLQAVKDEALAKVRAELIGAGKGN